MKTATILALGKSKTGQAQALVRIRTRAAWEIVTGLRGKHEDQIWVLSGALTHKATPIPIELEKAFWAGLKQAMNEARQDWFSKVELFHQMRQDNPMKRTLGASLKQTRMILTVAGYTARLKAEDLSRLP